jgi:hypothetical protein
MVSICRETVAMDIAMDTDIITVTGTDIVMGTDMDMDMDMDSGTMKRIHP